MQYQLKSVAMHITNNCSHGCPMCYATPEGQLKCEGNIEILKTIADELKNAGVEEINLVGGDPAEYSKIGDLVQYLYDLGFQVPILSNTHNYKNSSVQEITPYVSSLEGTIHATTAEAHDTFCKKSNAYNTLIQNLKIYSELKSSGQQLGIVMNIMEHNYNLLYDSIEALLERNLPIDYVLIQRIGPYGKAIGTTKYGMSKEKIVVAFENIDRINKQLGIPTNMVDAFPYCIIPQEYHKYLSKCDWGYGTAAVDMNGNLSRCALSTHYSLGNILETPVNEIWQNSPILQKFRSKKYLRMECQNCKNLENCGGGCAMSCGNDELSDDTFVKNLKR